MNDTRNTPDGTITFHGTGQANPFRCGVCDKPSAQLGSRTKFALGMRRKLCGRCAKAMGT